jgi:hypothetical protein
MPASSPVKRKFILLSPPLGIQKAVPVYFNRQPRHAALKAARAGYTDIRLHEEGTGKVHIYEGTRVEQPAPASAPEWMSSTIMKPAVRKLRIQRL